MRAKDLVLAVALAVMLGPQSLAAGHGANGGSPQFSRGRQVVAELKVPAEARPGKIEDPMAAVYNAYISGDFDTALRTVRPLAEKGNFKAQFVLGYMYENGHILKQDYAAAALWYRKAADQGDAISQISLGLLYEEGHGVSRDYAEAARLYRDAADSGSARAHYRLGVMYRFGHGVRLDLVMAHVHFNIAAAGFTVRPAEDSREAIAKQMTPSQINLARQIARQWLLTHPPVVVGEPVGNIPE